MKPARAARLLFQLPRSSRVYSKLQPTNQWGWDEIFANKTNYLLEMIIWQNSYDPKKKHEHKANRPKPFVPEFMKLPVQPSAINNGSEAHTADEIRNILAKPRV